MKGPLVDTLSRAHSYLRISVTDRCNLRCTCCMPPEGVVHKDRREILDFDEIVRLTTVFAAMGVTKVRLTGGEPLVRADVTKLVADLVRVDGIQTVAMTTNAVLLEQYARSLRSAGLDQLNVGLDTLQPDRFERITLHPDFDCVIRGIDAALGAGFTPLKLNMVVIGGCNDDEILDFVELARAKPIHVRFIEYMPFPGNGWDPARLVPCREMMRSIATRYPLEPIAGADTANVVTEFQIPGSPATVGFIAPMTEPFCRHCSRLRLTADGFLKTCLHRRPERSLRHLIRAGCSDEQIEREIRTAVLEKRATWSSPEQQPTRSMVQIGG